MLLSSLSNDLKCGVWSIKSSKSYVIYLVLKIKITIQICSSEVKLHHRFVSLPSINHFFPFHLLIDQDIRTKGQFNLKCKNSWHIPASLFSLSLLIGFSFHEGKDFQLNLSLQLLLH